MSNSFTSLNRNVDPLDWKYHSEFGTTGSRVEIAYVKAVYCITDVLKELGIRHELLAVSHDTFILSERDMKDGEKLDTWKVHAMDLADTKPYSDVPSSSHPLLEGLREEEIELRQGTYHAASCIVKIPQYSMLLECANDRLTFITQPLYFCKVDLICNYIGERVFYSPVLAIPPEQPKVNLVGRSSDGQFFSTLMYLPENPITDDMLRDCYDVVIGKGERAISVDGQQLMTDMVENLSVYVYSSGIDTYPNKGLYIIHGEPGTGKSKILTELLLRLERADDDRDVYYFPPQAIELLGAPEFMTWLYSRQGCIIVAEDAESVLRASEVRTAATSNILNITDGLLGDALQITIIATFNCDISELDAALLRPGRLKMQADFKRLTPDKALDAYCTILRDKYDVSEEDVPAKLPVEASTYSLAELYQMLPDLTALETDTDTQESH